MLAACTSPARNGAPRAASDSAHWAPAPMSTPDRDGRARKEGAVVRAVLPTLIRWVMNPCPLLAVHACVAPCHLGLCRAMARWVAAAAPPSPLPHVGRCGPRSSSPGKSPAPAHQRPAVGRPMPKIASPALPASPAPPHAREDMQVSSEGAGAQSARGLLPEQLCRICSRLRLCRGDCKRRRPRRAIDAAVQSGRSLTVLGPAGATASEQRPKRAGARGFGRDRRRREPDNTEWPACAQELARGRPARRGRARRRSRGRGAGDGPRRDNGVEAGTRGRDRIVERGRLHEAVSRL